MQGLYDTTTGQLKKVIESTAGVDMTGLVTDIIPANFNPATMVRTGVAAFAVSQTMVDAATARSISAVTSPFSTVTLNTGYPSKRSGKVDVSVIGMTVGKPVAVWLAPGPYPGKGGATSYDESQRYDIQFSGIVISATIVRVFWSSRFRVGGKINVNMQIGS